MFNYYEILGVKKNASKKEIQKAYRIAARKYHPDVNSDEDSIKRFKQIQEAYENLIDPQKKAKYDSNSFFNQEPDLEPSSTHSNKSTFDLFSSTVYRGANIHLNVKLSLEDICIGCNKHIFIKRKIKCSKCLGECYTEFKDCGTCKGTGTWEFTQGEMKFVTACSPCLGTGKVGTTICDGCMGNGYDSQEFEQPLFIKIPAGVDNNTQIVFKGYGQLPHKNGNAGDLIVRILIEEHEIFTKDNNNLLVDIPLSYSELALGCMVQVPTLLDGMVQLKVPAGTSSHTKLRLQNRGLSNEAGNFGDLIVTVKLDVPKKLSDDYRKLCEKMGNLEKTFLTPRKEMWRRKLEKYRGKNEN